MEGLGNSHKQAEAWWGSRYGADTAAGGLVPWVHQSVPSREAGVQGESSNLGGFRCQRLVWGWRGRPQIGGSPREGTPKFTQNSPRPLNQACAGEKPGDWLKLEGESWAELSKVDPKEMAELRLWISLQERSLDTPWGFHQNPRRTMASEQTVSPE